MAPWTCIDDASAALSACFCELMPPTADADTVSPELERTDEVKKKVHEISTPRSGRKGATAIYALDGRSFEETNDDDNDDDDQAERYEVTLQSYELRFRSEVVDEKREEPDACASEASAHVVQPTPEEDEDLMPLGIHREMPKRPPEQGESPPIENNTDKARKEEERIRREKEDAARLAGELRRRVEKEEGERRRLTEELAKERRAKKKHEEQMRVLKETHAAEQARLLKEKHAAEQAKAEERRILAEELAKERRAKEAQEEQMRLLKEKHAAEQAKKKKEEDDRRRRLASREAFEQRRRQAEEEKSRRLAERQAAAERNRLQQEELMRQQQRHAQTQWQTHHQHHNMHSQPTHQRQQQGQYYQYVHPQGPPAPQAFGVGMQHNSGYPTPAGAQPVPPLCHSPPGPAAQHHNRHGGQQAAGQGHRFTQHKQPQVLPQPPPGAPYSAARGHQRNNGHQPSMGAPPMGQQSGPTKGQKSSQFPPSHQKHAVTTNESSNVIQDTSAIKRNVLINWALQPPMLRNLRPIYVLITTIHNVFPPAFGVAAHDYFAKWTPITMGSLAGAQKSSPDEEKLKKAVRKVRVFLHPDKLPRHMDEQQSFVCKMSWDVVSDAWEEHQSGKV